MKLEAVIFDLDGTLIDSMGIWVDIDRHFLAKRGIQVPDDIFADIEGGNSFTEVAQYFKKKFHLSESVEEIKSEWTEMVLEKYKNSIKLKPNVIELLRYLQNQKIKMAVGTSNNDELTYTVLRVNEIEEYFSAIITADANLRGKPFPDIFLRAADELETDHQNCLVIEDVLVGALAAQNAGMNVYIIEDKHSHKDREKIESITGYIFHDFKEITKKIKEEIEK